uniref:Uncharacterized protein n=1 Tax=Arundo donax TaxID=35708 RepID=A0A0A9EWJ8_ARUDO
MSHKKVQLIALNLKLTYTLLRLFLNFLLLVRLESKRKIKDKLKFTSHIL